jgi:glutamate N-acetyltransferase/amino-acid N-acetyltransferase
METHNCLGFQTAAVASGLKKDGAKDLGLIFSQVPANVAGVFTRNKVQAAPVLLDKERIQSGSCQAIIVNSGNANCCTGEQGMRDAKEMARLAASALKISPELVQVASTGVIGEPLPMAKIESAVPALVDSLQSDDFSDVAAAILTTDTVLKIFSESARIDGQAFTVTGIAKGAGMIRPDMATMLCFICSDVGMPSNLLQAVLHEAVEKSFNRMTIDGDTSTNDTVLLMANGLSGVTVEAPAQQKAFRKVLDDVLIRLTKMLVKDGEGATKLVEIIVTGAPSDENAAKIAETVSHSNLVKTALFGEDANWGRIMAAIGRAGVPIDPNRIDIFFDDVQMVKNGTGCGEIAEAEATKVLKKPEFSIIIELKIGNSRTTMLTCDFSIDYVKINADYRS